MLTVNLAGKSRTPLEQLIDVAQSNKLYDQDVLNTLGTNDEKIKYLEILASANSLALSNRISADGYDYSAIDDKRLKFQALETEYELAIQASLASNAEYQTVQTNAYNKQLNEQFAKDERITGNNAVKTIVDTKYSGDYSKFMSEYKDAETFFADEYLSFADMYDKAETAEVLKYMQESASTIESSQDINAQLLARKTRILEAIAVDAKTRIERIAWENASWVEKTSQSMKQIILAPITELGNVLEGVIDVAATGAMAIAGLFGGGEEIKDFIAKDTIPLDTLLAEALPYSYITSPYAKDNPLKWLYEIETSIIDMAPMALNLVAPGVGTFIYYASSAGRTTEGYINEFQDAGIGEIIAYTTMSTTVEFLTEKLNTDVVFGKGLTEKWTKMCTGNKVLEITKAMIGEGVEEVISETGSQITASLLRGKSQMNFGQIVRAGALGAAVGGIMQTASYPIMTKRLLGINTTLTNAASGMSINLSARESATVEQFLETCKTKLDKGKTLSERDAAMYERFKGYDRTFWMDGKKIIAHFAKIESGSGNYTYSGVMPTENAQSDWMNTKRYDNELDWQLPTMTEVNGADMTQYTTRTNTAYTLEQRNGRNIISQQSMPDITTSTATADVTGLYSSLEMLVETVNNGADEKTITEAVEEIIPQETIEEMRTELQQMSTVWFNSLVADENSQDVLQAVNDYYNRSLENIIERLDFTPAHGGNVEKQAKNLGLALNANITITTEKSGATVYNQLRTAFGRAYPDYNLVSFVSDNANTPVVTVIGKDVYVDHRYIRDTNITSIVKQIETQILCDTFYSELNADAQQMLTDIQNKAYDTPLFNVYRRNQLNKQILYSALFVPNNPMAIALSELDHTAYENLRDILLEQAKVKNVAIKNAAYRGLKVYDLTILSRMSADEAVSKNLLSGNYSIEDLLNERGPDSERYTFKYGMDASQAGVRVLSAVRHLADNFGFETNIDNLYTVLGDILDPNKYSKFDEFQKVLNMYSNWNEFTGEVETVPSRIAINLYLRDQFDFEIDGRGNIIATKDVEALVDIDKALAALDEGKPIAVQNILTQEGIQVFSPSECVMVFVDEIEGAQGNKQSNTVGKSLITISKKPGKRDFIDVIFHELQHHLTTHAHQPFGAAQVLKAGVLQSVYKTTTDKAQFLRDMLTAIEDHASKEETRNKCTELLALPDDKLIECAAPNDMVDDEYLDWANTMVYQYYDMDEQQSNFNIVKVGADAPGAYFSTTGAGPAVLRVNAQNLRGSAAAFLNRFEGLSIIMRATDVDAKLNQITAGTETFDSLIIAANFAEIEESSDARAESDGLYDKLLDTLETHGTRPTTKQLCQPTYWAQHCTNKELKARVVTYTPADCKQLVQRLTGYVFDDYQGEFVQPENVFKPADYIKYTSSTGFIQARENTTVIQLPRDYKPGKDTKLDRALSELSEEQKNTAAYYVDDRLFANINAAIDFTNSDKVVTAGAESNQVKAVFDQFIDALPQTGFEFRQDFVLITHDGKVVGYDSKGKPGEVFKAFAEKLWENQNLTTAQAWQRTCQGLQVDMDTGNYIGNLESGRMKQLLNSKKIVRAYRVGDSWEAYGKPNYIQDLYLRQMNTTSKQVSYLTPADPIYTQYLPGTARLVVNEKGAVTVDRGQYAGYPEVSWKNNTWYRAMIQIIEKYDIRKLSELKQLGFNDSFIESMKRNYGRTIQTGTAAKLGLSQQFVDATRKYTGVAQDVITQFINDESAHPFARNLLIQNAQVRASTDNLNWAMCPHIRTVEDVDNYLRAMLSYFGTLSRKKNYTKYSSLGALMAAANSEYRASDSTIAGINDATFADASYDTLTTLFLNTDARQRGKANRVVTKDENGNIISEEYVDRLFNAEGLDYSLKGFEAALGAIRRGYASEKTSEHGRGNVRSSDIDVKAKGGHSDEGGTISLADTSAKAIAQSLLNGAEAKLETQENVPYLNTFKRGITEALKHGDNTEKALSVLNKLEKYLVTENAKVVDNEEGAWDSYLKQLHTYTKKLQKVLGESGKTTAATSSVGVSDLITAAKERIDKSEDKLKQQDAEYQLLTNNRARLITQYSETGYKQLLEAVKAMKPKDASGKSVGMSNITDNISKRLRNGNGSIQNKIDAYPDSSPNKIRMQEMLDYFREMNQSFKGVKTTTAGLTDMRFKYSNLLNDMFKFVQAPSQELLNNIKISRTEIANYLNNLVLTGDYNYRLLAEDNIRDSVDFYMNAVEQLISGKITLSEFTEFKDASLEVRIETVQALIDTCIDQGFPSQAIDRMRKLLDDASVIETEESSDARPKIDLSILKLAQSRANLSEDAAGALNKTVDKLNQEWKDARGDAARKAEMSNAVKAAQEATNKATYMTRSVDRLTRQYRKYLNSPAITQEEAEALIKHAATMIEVHDYQTKSDAFRKRIKKEWQALDSKEWLRVKGLLYYDKHKKWPKFYIGPTRGVDPNNPTVGGTNEPSSAEIEMAKRSAEQWKSARLSALEYQAIKDRPVVKSSVSKVQNTVYEQYAEETSRIRQTIEDNLDRYLVKHKDKTYKQLVDELGYNPSDAVNVRQTQAILELFFEYLDGSMTRAQYDMQSREILRRQTFEEVERPKYAVAQAVSTKTASTLLTSIETVNDLLNMYNERTTETTPDWESLPTYQRYYTTHKSFDDILEQAGDVMAKYKTTEHERLNGIVNGVQKAITEFQYRPMTLASAIKFINDIRTILQDGKLNESLFSWKDNVPLERLSHNAFDEFETMDTGRTIKTTSGAISMPERIAKGTTLTAVDNMMKYLKSGKFTSHAQEIEQQFDKAVDEISGAVNTLLETEYAENVTEEDKKPESELSSRMRHKEDNKIDNLALAAFEAEFDEIEESSDFRNFEDMQDIYQNILARMNTSVIDIDLLPEDERDRIPSIIKELNEYNFSTRTIFDADFGTRELAKLNAEYGDTDQLDYQKRLHLVKRIYKLSEDSAKYVLENLDEPIQVSNLKTLDNSLRDYQFTSFDEVLEKRRSIEDTMTQLKDLTAAINKYLDDSSLEYTNIPENSIDILNMPEDERHNLYNLRAHLTATNFADKLLPDRLFTDDELDNIEDEAQDTAVSMYSHRHIAQTELDEVYRQFLIYYKRIAYLQKTYDIDKNTAVWLVNGLDEIEESSDLLDDVDWEFDDLEYEDEQPTTEPTKPEPKAEQPKAEKKSKKEDTRPIEEQFKPEDEASRSSYKTTRSELLTRNGVDITKALEYQFKDTVSMDIYGTDVERQRVSTQEFITNPEVSQVIRQLLNNEAAIKDFLAWLSEARAIDEVTSLKALIILNKIEASPTLSFELRKEAQAIRKYKKSIAGAVLGLGNRHGLVPAEELSMLATDMLKITDKEREQLKAITDAQKVAIDNGDFAAADEAMKELFKILQEHQHELDISINPFGKTEHSEELQKVKAKLETVQTEEERKSVQEEIDRLRTIVDEERAVRWHNLTDKITTWRFFAMLSAPSTFFAKNVAGNYVAKGMNRASEVFASGFEKLINKKRGFKYTNTTHKASDAAKRATDTQLVQSGILDGIMSNTVARYETGYVYRPSVVRNLSIDLSKSEELEPSKAATLRGILRAETPFGKMNEKGETNFAAAALNKMYGIIFGTMNKWDKKFMQADIQRLTEQLCTNNFTPDELEMLANKTADEALLTKFYEIVEFARQEACKTYFRSQPKFYNDLMAMLNKHPIAQAVVSTIMPFPRMVVNATMTALVYSPFGYIKGLMTLQTDKSMFANIRASQEFGKATVGSIAMVAAALLAALGVLDIDEEDPYTGPQLTIGDLRVSLEGLEPSATPFITGAMLVLGSKYDNTGAFTSAANALLNTTVLGEMLSAFGNDDTPSAWIGSLFASYVTQFIPTILRRFTQLIDPSKKTYSGKGKAFKRIVAAIPFASYAIEDKIDPYSGETIMQHTDAGNIWLSRFLVLFNAVSPTKISWDTDSSVEKESKDVGAATTGPAKTITKNGTKYEIPKKLYNEYKVLRAQLYSQYAGELIKTDAYKKLSNDKKAKKLKALQERATNEARKQLNIETELNIP